MIKQLKIENLRSIKDSGFISMKPINILVGRNSSGKSTFLRSFPLISQSIKKDLRGPISWVDDAFVDFGDYETAINKYAKEGECIQFSFNFEDVESYRSLNKVITINSSKYLSWANFRHPIISGRVLHKIKDCIIGFASDSKGTYVQKISFCIDEVQIHMSVDKRESYVNIRVDGKNLQDYKIRTKWIFNTSRGILPSFDRREYVYECVLLLKKMCSKHLTIDDRIVSLFWNIQDKKHLLDSIKSTNIKSLQKKVALWDEETKDFLEVYYNWYMMVLANSLTKIDEYLSIFYSECSYIAPARAEANRYYRNQGLQVSDVDSYGRNLQEFISSLSEGQNTRYVSFVEDILGVRVSVENKANHLSIMLTNINGIFNIADVGFGYSQILPIITKLWFATEKRKRQRNDKFNQYKNSCNTILMEQPELHLHPAMQAKVADAFIKTYLTCKSNDLDVRLFIETHSQSLINRLGRRISEGKICKEDVNILVFDKDKENKNTIITKAEFKDNGQISNWPAGFFDPDNF